MSRAALVLILFLVFTGRGYAQEFRAYDYSDIGLTFMVPAGWQHDGLVTTTKAAFIKQFGWVYDQPDADDIWHAVGSFSSVAVDSSRFPSDAALTMHKMTIFVSRAHTLYRRWLCLQRRVGFFESRPLVNKKFELIQRDKINSFNLPPNLSDAKGITYQYFPGHIELLTHGHVFNFIHQEKCYEVKLESTSANPIESIRLHERILNSVERSSF